MFAALDKLTSPTTDPSEQDFAVLGVLFLVIDLTAGFLCFKKKNRIKLFCTAFRGDVCW